MNSNEQKVPTVAELIRAIRGTKSIGHRAGMAIYSADLVDGYTPTCWNDLWFHKRHDGNVSVDIGKLRLMLEDRSFLGIRNAGHDTFVFLCGIFGISHEKPPYVPPPLVERCKCCGQRIPKEMRKAGKICLEFLAGKYYPDKWDDKNDFEKGVDFACRSISELMAE